MSEKRFLSSQEVAIFLGLSKPTVDRLVAKGRIPNYKVGKRRLFDQEELVEWVKSHKDPPPPGKSKRGKPIESYPGPTSSPKSGQKSKKERR